MPDPSKRNGSLLIPLLLALTAQAVQAQRTGRRVPA